MTPAQLNHLTVEHNKANAPSDGKNPDKRRDSSNEEVYDNPLELLKLSQMKMG